MATQGKGYKVTMDMITNTIAVGAITSPLWLTNLSNIAGSILPILGAVWLIVQIVHKVAGWTRERPDLD